MNSLPLPLPYFIQRFLTFIRLDEIVIVLLRDGFVVFLLHHLAVYELFLQNFTGIIVAITAVFQLFLDYAGAHLALGVDKLWLDTVIGQASVAIALFYRQVIFIILHQAVTETGLVVGILYVTPISQAEVTTVAAPGNYTFHENISPSISRVISLLN